MRRTSASGSGVGMMDSEWLHHEDAGEGRLVYKGRRRTPREYWRTLRKRHGRPWPRDAGAFRKCKRQPEGRRCLELASLHFLEEMLAVDVLRVILGLRRQGVVVVLAG